MKRWGGAVVGLGTLLAFAAAACGGGSTTSVASRTPSPWVTPSAWVTAPGWVKVTAFSGRIGETWAYGPYFHVDGGRVRVVGGLNQDQSSGSEYVVELVPRRHGVSDSSVGFMPLKTAFNPAVSNVEYFEAISERSLAAGDYRVAIWGSPGTYSLTVYVHV